MIHEFKTVKELREYLKDDKIILAKKDFVFGVGKYAEYYSTDYISVGHSNRMVLDGYCTYKYKVSRDIFIQAIKTIEEIEMEDAISDSPVAHPHKHKELIEKWVKDTNQKVWCWGSFLNEWFIMDNPDWKEGYKYLVQQNDPNTPEIPKYKEITVNGVSGIKVLNVEWLKLVKLKHCYYVSEVDSGYFGQVTINCYTTQMSYLFFETLEEMKKFLEKVKPNPPYTIS